MAVTKQATRRASRLSTADRRLGLCYAPRRRFPRPAPSRAAAPSRQPAANRSLANEVFRFGPPLPPEVLMSSRDLPLGLPGHHPGCPPRGARRSGHGRMRRREEGERPGRLRGWRHDDPELGSVGDRRSHDPHLPMQLRSGGRRSERPARNGRSRIHRRGLGDGERDPRHGPPRRPEGGHGHPGALRLAGHPSPGRVRAGTTTSTTWSTPCRTSRSSRSTR